MDPPLNFFHRPYSKDWGSITQGSAWQYLEELELDNIVVSRKTYIEFLARHAKKIKFIGFGNLLMLRGTWAYFFCSLKGRIGEFVHLKEISMKGILGVDQTPNRAEALDLLSKIHKNVNFGDKINEYLFKGGKNPFIRSYYQNALLQIDAC